MCSCNPTIAPGKYCWKANGSCCHARKVMQVNERWGVVLNLINSEVSAYWSATVLVRTCVGCRCPKLASWVNRKKSHTTLLQLSCMTEIPMPEEGFEPLDRTSQIRIKGLRLESYILVIIACREPNLKLDFQYHAQMATQTQHSVMPGRGRPRTEQLLDDAQVIRRTECASIEYK